MNKAKLVELADEVLTEIDFDMQNVLRKELEMDLCKKLSDIFLDAKKHHWSDYRKRNEEFLISDSIKVAETYEAVKPILDDCIDKLLGKENE